MRDREKISKQSSSRKIDEEIWMKKDWTSLRIIQKAKNLILFYIYIIILVHRKILSKLKY